jgi:hypothetical protein
MMQQTLKCKICGEPYIFYAHSAADQSACPKCVAKAKKNYKWIPSDRTPPLNIGEK